ncbi:MAG: phosphatidylserine/phosphatidylglycerophosphate/cardiolipin synthase family protein [Patescibacteria group bacterium]
MLAAIGVASESIYIEMFTFDNDTTGYDFFSALERKARDGLRVIVVLDIFGSFRLPSTFVNRLRGVGAEVLFFSYWFRRTHRKILIVDESVAFLGGVNIAHRFAHWNDLQVRVSGKIVRHVLHSFARVYHECGGKNPRFLDEVGLPITKKARLWFIEHGIGGKRYALRKHYEEHIDGARQSIVVVTPYLLPHRWLIACLHRAINRKIDVTIIVPKHTDYRILDRINYYYIDLFSKLGARCFLSGEMNHAKVMLIDERLGTVGSQNLDILSFGWNVEAGVFFDKSKMVRDLRLIIEKWKRDANPFAPTSHPPYWHDIALALLLRFFQPIP